MFFLALTASAAPLEIVLEGQIYAGSIEGTSVVGQEITTILTVDDAVVANSDGVFDYTAGSMLTVDIPVLGETLILDNSYDFLAAVFSGNGFVVNQGIYGASLGFAFAEDYVVEPPVDFSNSTLAPFGAWALDEGGNGQINAQADFTGETSGDAYAADPFAGAADVRIQFSRVHVRVPGFYEDTIDAFYGSDIIDEGAGFNRRPSTIQANIDALDDALTDAGCFVDVGDPYAGEFTAGVRTGEGMLGALVDLTNTGGRSFSGTIGANTVDGIQNRKGKAVAADGADFVAGYYQRTTGKRGFWYAVRVTDCTLGDVEGWFGSSLAALD